MHRPSPQPNLAESGNQDEAFTFNWRFWILVVVTGVATGLGAGLLMLLLRFVQHFSWNYTKGSFLEGVEPTSALHRVLVLSAAGVLAAAALWSIHRVFGKSAGGLSGSIWFRSGRLPLLETLCSGVLSIVLVGMGVSLGREAAPKEFGAAIASKLCQWAKLSRAQRRVLAACGAGAGMGAVYNVPLGGALFGLEVLLGTLQLPLVLPAIATSLIATAVSWLFLAPAATYTIPSFPISTQQVVWALWAGPVIGLFTVLYIRAIAWAGSHKPQGRAVIWLPIVVISCLGVVSIAFPQLLGNGKNIVQLTFENNIGIALLAALIVLKPLVTTACLRTGAPGGLFTPTMTCGALAGALLGNFWNHFWPGAPGGSYALIGSAALLAAATQGPLSSVVLVLELTRRLDPIMVPILLAVAGASIVTRVFESRSIYSGRTPIHLPEAVPDQQLRAMRIPRAALVSAAAPYATVLEKMLRLPAGERQLYVMDQAGKLSGTISQTDLQKTVAEFGSPCQVATAFDLATSTPVSHADTDRTTPMSAA